MNDDYLWDKTGEPDPQIQELEEVLGTLRLKPRPLVIPADLQVPRRRTYRPWMAIAAAVVFAVVAAGIWFSIRTSLSEVPQRVDDHANNPGASVPVTPQAIKRDEAPQFLDQKEKREQKRNSFVASNRRSSSTPRVKKVEPEAEAAKEQIMLAIRLASEKFNIASRRTQSPAAGQIRNQHKIG